MNAALVSTHASAGGAALAAKRLHDGLIRLGVSSRLMVRRCDRRMPGVVPVLDAGAAAGANAAAAACLQERAVADNRSSFHDSPFNLPYPGFDLPSVALWADVVNLHWVTRFMSPESVGHLLDADVPVVWTLHDCWAFTGGCHYPGTCTGYRDACRDCPQLEDDSLGLPSRVLARKIERWGDRITVVTPSRWLAGVAAGSALFRNSRIETIENGIDPDGPYRPEASGTFRQRHGIAGDAVVVLLSSYDFSETRKGAVEARQALMRATENETVKDMAEKGKLVVVMAGASGELDVPVRTIGLGRLAGDDRMAEAYAAADGFLLPSREDNLPNTMIESMASGTPVIAFAAGGIPEAVTDGETGLLAPVGDVPALAAALVRFITDASLRSRCAGMCAPRVQERFTDTRMAERYAALYRDIAGGRRKRSWFARKPWRSVRLRDDSFEIPDYLADAFREVCPEFVDP